MCKEKKENVESNESENMKISGDLPSSVSSSARPNHATRSHQQGMDGAARSEEEEETEGCRQILGRLTLDEAGAAAEVPCGAAAMALRHYRAEKGDVASASRKMGATLRWRKEFGVRELTECFDDGGSAGARGESPEAEAAERRRALLRTVLREEARTGKLYVRGHDRGGRAIMYMAPGRENTRDETNQMRFLVYSIERALACTAAEQARRGPDVRSIRPGEEKMCIIIDFDCWTLLGSPPMSTTMYTIDILQNHYCERMHRAYVFNPPRFFTVFWNLVKNFIDPVTREKMQFCHGPAGLERVRRDIDLDLVENFVGGTNDLRSFDAEEYFVRYPMTATFDQEHTCRDTRKVDYTNESQATEETDDIPSSLHSLESAGIVRCNSVSVLTGTF